MVQNIGDRATCAPLVTNHWWKDNEWEKSCSCRKNSPTKSCTLQIRQTEMGSNPVLRGKNLATKSLSHDKALTLDLKTATRQVVVVAAAEIMMITM